MLSIFPKNPSKMTPFFNNVFPPEVVTFISQRPDDFSLKANQNDLTEEQKDILSAQLGFPVTKAASVRQVHGNRVVLVDEAFMRRVDILEEADGLVTKMGNVPLVIRTADCLPVFLYDAEQKGLGLIHAGWKSSQKNIVGQALQIMADQWQSDPNNIKAAFGPAIHSCCNEVDKEFEEYFQREVMARDGRYYLDLAQVNRNQLMDLGVPEKNISDCKICTYCNQNYFSYRREGESAGRMVSLMMLKEGK